MVAEPFDPNDGDTAADDDDYIAAVARLSRDLRAAAASLSEREAKYLVAAYYNIQEIRIRSKAQRKKLNEAQLPSLLVSYLGEQTRILEDQLRAALDKFSAGHRFAQWPRSVIGIGPVLAAGLVANFDPIPPPTAGHWWSFAGINPAMKWNPGEKRPFSAMLKVLQWKISGSFVKFSGHERDVYGKFYRREKERYITNNDRGAYIERAKTDAKRVDRKTDAWKWYAGCYPAGMSAAYEAEGRGLSADARQRAQKKLLDEARGVAGDGLPMLPPGHVDNRARRWVAKLFISHYHHVCFGIYYGEDPPKPYVISHLHHAHAIDPPNWREYI